MAFKLIRCTHRHCVCSITTINLITLFLGSAVSFTHLEYLWYEILISTASLQKAASRMTVSGGLLNFLYSPLYIRSDYPPRSPRISIGLSFKTAKALIYRKDQNGFYVYAKPNFCDTDAMVKYISRYLGRPVIVKKDEPLWKSVPKSKRPLLKSFTKWRKNVLLSFGYEPLIMYTMPSLNAVRRTLLQSSPCFSGRII